MGNEFYAWLALGGGGAIIALIFAYVFFRTMKAADPGNEKMQEIAKHVRDGAFAYLKQQYKVVGLVFVVLFIIFSIMSYGMGLLPGLVPFAFLSGGIFSGICGFLGMNTATLASNRTAEGARQSLNRGLQVGFRSGAVMGLVVVGFALIDVVLWFLGIRLFANTDVYTLEKTTVTMLSFGIGASTQALFARVGGGIYTKAADVGADLVGKVEAGIPEDDPRNPATIADNVGDNVGDVAGMGADLYESFAGSILATMALGVAAIATLAAKLGDTSVATDMLVQLGLVDVGLTGQALTNAVEQAKFNFIFAPMALAGVGSIFSIIGTFLVRSGDEADQSVLLKALYRGINVASGGTALAAWPVIYLFCGPELVWGIWGAIVAGLVAGYGIGKATEYYTSHEYAPTRGIAKAGETGPATVIIEGVAVGMMSTVWPVLFVVAGILVSFAATGGFTNPAMGLYGVGIAAVGMLSTLGITLATDAYGPIADNAGGNAEMAGLDPIVRERTDALDALGNTTAAVGKGFAIGSAALTALALLAAYIEEVRSGLGYVAKGIGKATTAAQNHGVEIVARGAEFVARFPDKVAPDGTVLAGTGTDVSTASLAQFMDFYSVNLMNPRVLVGMFLGSMMAYLFCALTMKAVGRAAMSMVEEVRRQFREIPGILEGTGTPDYALCVDISTKGAQKEMMVPSLIAIAAPVVVGLFLGVAGVLGLLAGTLSAGFVLAVMMAGAGGAWDNAKKYVEEGHHGGKGSEAHKATVTGDTVGDPFKDTSGPSLNILIKLMTMVSVVVAAVVVKYGPVIG
ncbi:MAG: sodium-translocating pyrophosphatase, partial [Planctomycetota bacterium]